MAELQDSRMNAPPAEWLIQRETEASEMGEPDAANEFRKETAEIVKAYADDDPAAKLCIAVHFREPTNFTEQDRQALEAVRADPKADERFERWSLMTAEQLINPTTRFPRFLRDDL
jgi:hypothetical protein